MAVQLNNVDLIKSSSNNVLDVDDTITKVGNIATDIQQAKNDLLGGAGAAYDTLQELATELQNNDSAIATLTSNIGTKADKPSSPTGTGQALSWDGSAFQNVQAGTDPKITFSVQGSDNVWTLDPN